MDLYEHMGKEIFAAHGIPTPGGVVATTPEEASAACERLGGEAIVKVQVQIGGRGKGGGVVRVGSPVEAADAARTMLDGGFNGMRVTRVLVEELLPIAAEFYAAITLDRSVGMHLAMVTSEGGMDIEQVARERPEALRRRYIDPIVGLKPFQVRYLTDYIAGRYPA